MMKWIIFWDAGYGKTAEEVEADTYEDAKEAAYEAWREETESNADYDAKPYTKELAEMWL